MSVSPACSRSEGERPTRRAVLRGCGALALVAVAAGGRAFGARGEMLRILCSGPAGSIPDLIARAASEQWPVASGVRPIVDNRPGAAGRIAVGALKAAPADGSVLLLAQGAIATVYPDLYVPLGYDASADLRPVSLAGEMSLGLAVGPAVPPDVATVADLLAWMRRHPEAANVGSPGTGTLPHVLAAMLFGDRDVAWQHVAYPGGPPAVAALLGGQIAALVLPEGLLRPHHAGRRARVLATSGSARSASLPEVATFADQGRPDLTMSEWFAFFAPGPTPGDVVEAASKAVRASFARPETASALAPAGIAAVSGTPESLAARIVGERPRWAAVLRAYGIRVE